MKIYVAFDDTDTLNCGRGTGKLARWFEKWIPVNCEMTGVVRQQLLVDPSIPYTSHNSSLCCIIEAPDESVKDTLIENAVEHIKSHFFHGSDPGLCVAVEGSNDINKLIEHGKNCVTRKVTQSEALNATKNSHLSGHGGTNDGIIGAAAAVGLTVLGESGRFIEYGNKIKLRDYPQETTVKMLNNNGIKVIPVDRNSKLPSQNDIVNNGGWLRPRLILGHAILPIIESDKNRWITLKKE